MGARLSRCDIAGDDFTGERVNLEWALRQREVGGFTNWGRPPAFRLIDDLGSGEGRTLYIGRRGNGKYTRIYEKGKQLGDPQSQWWRLEVEFGAKHRVLPLDMLTRPAEYLAAAFPCTGFFASAHQDIRTSRRRGALTLGRITDVARQQSGRAINALLMACNQDAGHVVNLLRRPGLPRRLNSADMVNLTGAPALSNEERVDGRELESGST